jgi:hypothetical protein
VRSCPDATFFHLSGWQKVIEQSFGIKTWFYYVEQDGQILGVLPLAEIKSRLFGHALGAMPFCVYGGVAAIDDSARVLLDGAADKLARELGVGHLEYRGMERAHPDDPSWQTKELYVTFRKAISGDDEENLNAIPRKQRAMVRKGIKLGLRGEVDSNVDRMFTAYAHSVHRLGTPVFPKKYFALLQGIRRRVRSAHHRHRGRSPGRLGAELLLARRSRALLRRRHGPGARSGRQRLHVLEPDAGRRRARLPPVRFRPQQARHRRLRFQEELGLHGPAAAL